MKKKLIVCSQDFYINPMPENAKEQYEKNLKTFINGIKTVIIEAGQTNLQHDVFTAKLFGDEIEIIFKETEGGYTPKARRIKNTNKIKPIK